MSEAPERTMCAHYDQRCVALVEANARIAALEQERDKALSMCRQAVDTGMAQAEEWDRFWRAMGVDSEDITVDEAIAKYAALEQERNELRETRKRGAAEITSRDATIARLREAIERNVVGRAREVAIGRPVAEVLIRYEMRDGESPQDTMCRIMRLTEGVNDG